MLSVQSNIQTELVQLYAVMSEALMKLIREQTNQLYKTQTELIEMLKKMRGHKGEAPHRPAGHDDLNQKMGPTVIPIILTTWHHP